MVSNDGKGVDDSTRRRRQDGDKSAFDTLYVVMYNADLHYSNDIMRPRISIGDWNGFNLLICCIYSPYCTMLSLS